jgi:thioredoxin 1
MIIHATKETFQKEVLEAEVPVLIDFWASWCAPCRMQGQILEKYQDKIDDSKAKICKVNVDEQPELAQQYGVMSIPTLVVVQNGKVKTQVTGVTQDAGLNRMLGL